MSGGRDRPRLPLAARSAGLIAAMILPLALLLTISATAHATVDVAAGKPATASSTEDDWVAGVGPQMANDGSEKTRWSSRYADGQWWRVDLGSELEVSRLWINWTSAYASSYRIEVSNDGVSYVSVWQGGVSDAGWKVHNWPSRSARYVRFYGVDSATAYGFSFSDFELYGFSSGAPVSGPPPPSGSGPASPPPFTTCLAITSWRAPGSLPRSDAAASGCVRRTLEKRPGNYAPNHYVPSDAEISTFRSKAGSDNQLHRYVTGNFAGTTDEIIQWAAQKWGIPEDWMRAQFVQESWWNQDALGDRRDGVNASLYPWQARIDSDSVYESMSIAQVKWRPDGSRSPGTEPLRWKSTAFIADYFGATIRYYYDGLCDYCGAGYSAGQEWQSIGAYFQPRPWWNANAQDYVSRVKGRLSNRTWARVDF